MRNVGVPWKHSPPVKAESLRCKSDGGRPSDIGLPWQVSNHRMRLWSKAMVVSNTEKAVQNRQVRIGKVNASEPLKNAS